MATHIIASAMPPKKAVDFSKYRVVKPAWVTDSIKDGRLLPWTDYRVFDEGPRQKTISFDGAKMFSQSTQQSPQGYREQTQNSFYTSQLLQSSTALNSQASSSPFQPQSARKPAPIVVEGIEDVDDLNIAQLDHPPIFGSPSPAEFATAADLFEDPSGDSPGPSKDTGAVQDTHEHESQEPRPHVSSRKSLSVPKAMTSEEHNALLLSDPKIRKSSTANPDFLKQFYSESRLHHLSAWKAQLKARMQKMAADRGPVAKGIRRKASRRYIMHVDFDSFFCAVSLKCAPEFRDKPAVVAHSTGSGSEIASCNYPARKFGVKNGMWMKRALELCPDLKILPYDFPAYEEASQSFYDAILGVGGVVQSVSIDEALVDITNIVLSATGSEGVGLSEGSIWREQEKADEIAANLRAEIKARTDCHVSVGIGGNILLAKIALRKAKPAGQSQIRPEEVQEVLGGLKVEDLPGVAYSIGGKLEEIGIKLVKDIRQTSKERLVSVLGPKTGEKLWEYARGIDKTEVGEQPIRKSVSADVSWGVRFINQEEAEEFVRNLCKELEKRLLNEGVKGKHLTMKIMRRALDAPLDPAKHLGHGKCDIFNKGVSFGVATLSAEAIGKEAVAILRSYKFSPGDIRGLGVQMTKLEPLKPSTGPDGSQKRLSFGGFITTPAAKRQKSEPIDEIESPEKPKRAELFDNDPITVDPLTPRKPKVHPALSLAKANAADEKANTPLNIAGTQFIMPTHPDSEMLAELPQDIRRSLLAQAKRSSNPFPAVSRPASPPLSDNIPSDIDPEVFNALPDDMKTEVLASYGRRPAWQRRLPQSPRNDIAISQPRDKATPPKRRIKDMFSRKRERERERNDDAEAKPVQTSFVTESGAEESGHDDDLPPDIDPQFLEELPEDMRNEVLEEHRRRRLAHTSDLGYHPLQHRQAAEDGGGQLVLPGGQTKLNFPPVPPKIAFTQSRVTDVKETKDLIKVWYEATRKEGPHKRDVVVLEKYVARVIKEERDMDKVRKLVRWLDLMVEDGADGGGKQQWRNAVDEVKKAVYEAMRQRGLGEMDFG